MGMQPIAYVFHRFSSVCHALILNSMLFMGQHGPRKHQLNRSHTMSWEALSVSQCSQQHKSLSRHCTCNKECLYSFTNFPFSPKSFLSFSVFWFLFCCCLCFCLVVFLSKCDLCGATMQSITHYFYICGCSLFFSLFLTIKDTRQLLKSSKLALQHSHVYTAWKTFVNSSSCFLQLDFNHQVSNPEWHGVSTQDKSTGLVLAGIH